jgi:POT family proton-dependent oligopeptide transporter
MGINVGALFAPHAANGIRNWYLKSQGFIYDQDLATQSNRILAGETVDTEAFTQLATAASTNPIGENIQVFAQKYIDVFSQGYNYAFGVAAISMVISLVVYIFWKKMLPDGSTNAKAMEANKQAAADAPQKPLAIFWAIGIGVAAALGIYYLMAAFGEDGFSLAFAAGLFIIFVAWILQISTKEEKPRISALLLVFVVVIFFWMAFHQNGLTMTLFARDYTTKTVSDFSMIFFNVWSLLAFGAALTGLGYALSNKSSAKTKMFGGIAAVVGGAIVYYIYTTFDPENRIQPEIFQHFNPFYIVFLTPLVIGFFAWLNKKGKEPTTPRKIGIGMILAAVAFTVLLIGSLKLAAPREFNLSGETIADSARVSHWWLISTYFIITIAELFLSPMGLSFVSKVSPVRFQGLMQGGWLAATAVGNKLLFVGSKMWDKIDLWQLWLIFIVFCVLSAAFIFSIMKKLEKATK